MMSRRSLRPGDDCGSLPIALLLTIVGVGLSVVLAGTVGAQQQNTQVELQRADAVNAAQAGIDVALAQIRNAVDTTDDSGDISKLPCNKPTTISAQYPNGYAFTSTVSVNQPATYHTEIYYLASKPAAGDLIWARNNKLTCVVGNGTAVLPQYALIATTGIGGPDATRTLFATYGFSSNLSNPNIAGGQIRVFRYSAADTELCFASPVDSPIAGDSLWTKVCDNTSKRQEFAYEANLNLVLVSSRTAANPRGMCLDGGSPPAAGTIVKFQVCAATTIARQQWGQNDLGAFQGTTDGVSLNQFCMNVSSPGTASLVKLARAPSANSDECYNFWDDTKTVFPDADVGTGRAGSATDQLVNNEQFGRCIDVTSNDVAAGFLIVFPCKQKPSGRILWNQEWIVPAIPTGETSVTGPIYTTCPASQNNPACSDGSKYCLTSPGSIAAGQYVKVIICPPGPTPANMTWTVREDTGFYSTSYRIESTYGVTSGVNYCMSPTDPTASSPDLWYTFGTPFSKLVLAKCTSTDLQKWNVLPFTVSNPLKDIVEH
jgi:hypothetical protein